MQLQLAFRQTDLEVGLDGLRLLLRSAVHQSVVGIPTPRKLRVRPHHPAIERIVQEQIRQYRADHASHNLAKLPFDLHVTIERAALRPQYRDGFAGAPLKLERLPDRQVQIRGADGTARPEPVGSCGPGMSRSR